jgi:hypothetical protein
VGGVRDVLQRAIARAEDNSTQLHIQLEFNAEITKRSRLPDYPWELAHDGQKFLAHHQVRFSRHIAHVATIPNLYHFAKLLPQIKPGECSPSQLKNQSLL